MIDLMKAATAWAEIPVRERSDMLFGLRAMAAQYAKSPLQVKQADARVLHAAINVLVAAGIALAKDRSKETEGAGAVPPGAAPSVSAEPAPSVSVDTDALAGLLTTSVMRALSAETTDEELVAVLEEPSPVIGSSEAISRADDEAESESTTLREAEGGERCPNGHTERIGAGVFESSGERPACAECFSEMEYSDDDVSEASDDDDAVDADRRRAIDARSWLEGGAE